MKKILLATSIALLLSACGEEKQQNTEENQGIVAEKDRVVNLDESIQVTTGIEPGKHYIVLKTPIESADNEIIEYFWYKCPHCYTFEKMLKHNYQLLIKDQIKIRQEHAAIAKHWVQDAQLFYALREMKLEKKSTSLLMEFFHNNDKENPKTFDQTLKEIGITQEELNKVYTSKPVIEALKKSYEDAIKAGVTGTPSIIVEGKYLMKNKAFKNYKELLEASIELAKSNDEEKEVK